jgi:hypothetical protein
MKTIFDADPTFPNAEFRVGLIGAHSVGKTSQARSLGQCLRSVKVITEGIRYVVDAMGYKSPIEVPDKALMQWKVLHWQIAHEKDYQRFITDRTTVDNAAYFERYMRGAVSEREYDAYMTTAREHARSYTHLIYFPVMWTDIEKDGFRDTDPTERIAVDTTVMEMVERFDVEDRLYTVTKDDVRDGSGSRRLEILQHLGLWQAIRELGLYEKVGR